MSGPVSSSLSVPSRLLADERVLADHAAQLDAARAKVLATLAKENTEEGKQTDESPRRPATIEALLLAGACARLTASSDEDTAAVADAALARLRASVAGVDRTSVLTHLPVVPSAGSDPASFVHLLADATRLDAGLRALGLRGTDAPIDAAVDTLLDGASASVRQLVESHDPLAPRLVAHALFANQQVAAWGAALPSDAALIVLADALSPTLTALFRGGAHEPVFDAHDPSTVSSSIATGLGDEPAPPASRRSPARSTERTRALRPDETLALGALLRRALENDAKLAIEPSLLELTPFFLASSAPSLVLHEDAHDESLLLASSPLAGTRLRLHLDAIELELLDPSLPEPLLLPIVGDEALAPCRCRAGMTARHFVFDPSDHPDVEAYALLLGDRVALLRA